MPITLPSNVAPNELIQSAWGNAVVDALEELDNEKLDLAGGTMTASLFMNEALVRAGRAAGSEQFQAVDINGGRSVSYAFYGDGTSITSIGTLSGFVGYASDADLRLQNNIAGGETFISANGDVVFRSVDTERMRLANTALLFGKTATDLTAAGTEIYGTGSSVLGMVASTTSQASNRNFYARHEGSADADGEAFAQYLRGSTIIGQVLQHSTTGIQSNLAGGFMAMLEISDPGAATTNGARVFARDNGSGKTQLVVRFQSGAVQVLATEP